MAVSTIAHDEQLRVSIGVDTHLDTHVAVAKNGRGRTIGRTDIPATPAGSWGSAPTSPASSWSPPGTTPIAWSPRRRSPSSAGWHPSRLNPGGDRKANSALYTVVISRLRHDPRTQAYMARRTAEGKSKKEIIRCLKRYVARELFAILTAVRTSAPVVT